MKKYRFDENGNFRCDERFYMPDVDGNSFYKADEVERVLKGLCDCLEEVAGCECYQPYGVPCWKTIGGEALCTACEAQRLLKELEP